MEDGLACGRADVDQHSVVGQADLLRRFCHEFEHALGFSRIQLTDIAEGVDVPLRGEYGKTCTLVIPARSTVRSVVSNAASSSAGNPTITSLVMLNSSASGASRRRYVSVV